jgi:hypothetical protein
MSVPVGSDCEYCSLEQRAASIFRAVDAASVEQQVQIMGLRSYGFKPSDFVKTVNLLNT